MSNREATLYLQDILTSITSIEEYINDLSATDFNKDRKTIHEDLPPLKEQVEKLLKDY